MPASFLRRCSCALPRSQQVQSFCRAIEGSWQRADISLETRRPCRPGRGGSTRRLKRSVAREESATDARTGAHIGLELRPRERSRRPSMKFFLTQRTSPNGENCAQASSVEPPNVGLLRAPSGMRVPAALLTSRGQTSVIDRRRERERGSECRAGRLNSQARDRRTWPIRYATRDALHPNSCSCHTIAL